jgi:ADP-heptose:LPS heptosyltransferase
MCEQAGIRGSVRLRPYLELSDAEKQNGRRVKRQVVIQSSGRSAQFFYRTKEWYPERFQEVVSRLKHEVDFVQLGSISDPPLEGVLDLRGKTSIRESAAILANSILFVGLVGFLMHLARAVECRSVVVYGGRELPEQTGYVCNTNIVGRADCSPCWRYDDCPGGRDCMKQITVDQVVEAVYHRIAEPHLGLAVQEWTL